MVARRALVVGSLLIGLAGCGGHSGHDPDGGGKDGDFRTCDMETRAVPYSAGMSRDSATGAFTITLVSVVTMPLEGPPVTHPAIGPATWTLAVADMNGTSPEGISLSAVAVMPDHSHPGASAAAAPDGQGGYTLGLNLFMGGFWTVTFTIDPPTGANDTVVFPLCVQN